MVVHSLATAVTRESLTGPSLDVSGLDARAAAEIAQPVLKANHACYLTGFPTEPEVYVTFLRHLGKPLENYRGDGQMSAYSLHPCLNRVRYVPRADGQAWVHEQAGPLPPHTARSWRNPRPKYFSMLKVDAGWRDVPAGQAGESLLVRWGDALRVLAAEQPDFEDDIRLLRDTPASFAADHVVEANSRLPVVYPLEDSESDFDMGARVKGEWSVMMRSLDLSHLGPSHRAAYTEAMQRFLEAAQDPRAHALFTMDAGDLIVIDNNRFGHGRLGFLPERTRDGLVELNPRELWSSTLD